MLSAAVIIASRNLEESSDPWVLWVYASILVGIAALFAYDCWVSRK